MSSSSLSKFDKKKLLNLINFHEVVSCTPMMKRNFFADYGERIGKCLRMTDLFLVFLSNIYADLKKINSSNNKKNK